MIKASKFSDAQKTFILKQGDDEIPASPKGAVAPSHWQKSLHHNLSPSLGPYGCPVLANRHVM